MLGLGGLLLVSWRAVVSAAGWQELHANKAEEWLTCRAFCLLHIPLQGPAPLCPAGAGGAGSHIDGVLHKWSCVPCCRSAGVLAMSDLSPASVLPIACRWWRS